MVGSAFRPGYTRLEVRLAERSPWSTIFGHLGVLLEVIYESADMKQGTGALEVAMWPPEILLGSFREARISVHKPTAQFASRESSPLHSAILLSVEGAQVEQNIYGRTSGPTST